VGGALIPLLAAFCAEYWGWRSAMFVPGAMCIIVGLFLINRLRDTPQSLGLPPIEKYRNDYPSAKHEMEQELPLKELLFKYVLRNRYVWLLAISYFFVYIIRTAINDWSVLFLVETKGYSLLTAGACVFWFEIGGVFGSLVAGFASDKIFRGRRGPINILFCFAVIFAIGALWFSPPGNPILDFGIMFLIGFLIFGPQMLIGMAAAELSHKKAAGSATGFVGWIAYLGAATAGYPLGKMTQEFGWMGFFIALSLCGLVSVGLLLPLWSIKTNPRFLKEEEKTKGLPASPTVQPENG
ncbi:MAG: MFS transporter, partial [Chlamydiales bacterium]